MIFIQEPDDWQNNITATQGHVSLIEPVENVYLVEYWVGQLRVRTPLYFSWSEAEANFVRRVEEEDYR